MASIKQDRLADGRLVFRVRIRRLGLLVSRAFPDRAQAEAWAGAQDQAFDRNPGAPALRAEMRTVSELIDAYRPSAPESYGGEALRYWRAHLGAIPLARVTPAMLQKHRDALIGAPTASHGYKTHKPRSTATVRNYLCALSAAFRFGIQELHWTADNPVRRVQKPEGGRKIIRYLTTEERAALIAACKASASPWLWPAVALSLTTGMRKGELHALLWRDVDLDRGLATLRHTKNGDTRGAPFGADVAALLRALPRKGDLLFPHGLEKPWATAIAQAVIKSFRWHDMRHDCGTRLTGKGVPTRAVMQLLGHRNPTMALRYQHVADATLREQVLGAMEGAL